jgi:glycosyltransferase involved in cell wall biosynthesis
VIAGRTISKGTKIVTFVARGLESMRGFDVFMKVAARIARQRSDVQFVIAGNDHAYYGWDPLHTGQKSFKSWVLDRVKHDPERFLFTGHVLPEELADILRLSDLHLYLTVPFVLSWSLLNAMACGCVVLGSDVPPVREVIDDGVHGLIEPLFDLDRLTEAALRVLDDPAAYKPLGEAARVRMETDFSLDVCVPRLKDYFERMASRQFQTQPTENSESPKPKSRKRGRKKSDNTED